MNPPHKNSNSQPEQKDTTSTLEIRLEMVELSEKKNSPTGGKSEREHKKRARHQRKVRFNGQVQGRVIPCVPEEEKEIIWYTSEDYDKARNNETILRACFSRNDELFQKNQENLNAQGVMTDDQISKMELLVQASAMAVLEEQERQEKVFFDANESGEFVLDFEKVASTYSIYSKEALKQAHNRAIRHEKHLKAKKAKPVAPPSPAVSPSRFLRRGISPTPPQGKKPLVRKLFPRPSVFTPKGSSKANSITPAA